MSSPKSVAGPSEPVCSLASLPDGTVAVEAAPHNAAEATTPVVSNDDELNCCSDNAADAAPAAAADCTTWQCSLQSAEGAGTAGSSTHIPVSTVSLNR